MPQLDEKFDRVITIGNAKGGQFKTTLCSNVAGILASPESRVLIVDLDPQGNIGNDLGYKRSEIDDNGIALANAIVGQNPDIKPVRDIRPGLDVLIGGEYLHNAADWMSANRDQAWLSMRNILDPFVDEYDLVLIDVPPGERNIRIAALGASRYLWIPTQPDEASTDAILETVSNMLLLNQPGGLNESLELIGITLVDIGEKATSIKRRAIRQIQTILRTDDVPEVFTAQVRSVKAPAVMARQRGLLFHELAKAADEGPKWWEVRSGKAVNADPVPVSVKSGAQDLKNVAAELMERLVEAENERYGTEGDAE